ncbi:MAG: four helix bundle protein [Chlorobi bacterium]|nr:four helix bundle protein [Chlorobiota bacterium]
MSYKDFTQLSVWQKGFELAKEIYFETKRFPDDERFGMISDMRRAANSIARNSAEGFGRYEARDKTRFYKVSRGGAYEVMSQVIIAAELQFIEQKKSELLIENCKSTVNELDLLLVSLEKKPSPPLFPSSSYAMNKNKQRGK